jgi:hypothetical protein
MIPRDTSPEAFAAQLEAYRRMSGAERVKVAFEMSLLVRDLALAGLRREHPDWAEQDLRLELLRRWYPDCSLPNAHR